MRVTGAFVKGMPLLAKAYAALSEQPMGRPELSRMLGVSKSCTCNIVDDLVGIGLVDQVTDGFPALFAAKTMGMEPVKAIMPKPRVWAVLFQAIYQVLDEQGPIGRAEIEALTGVHHQSIARALLAMRGSGIARIAAWQRREGSPIELWSLGGFPDAQRPAPIGSAEASRKWAAANRKRKAQVAILSALRPDLIRQAA